MIVKRGPQLVQLTKGWRYRRSAGSASSAQAVGAGRDVGGDQGAAAAAVGMPAMGSRCRRHAAARLRGRARPRPAAARPRPAGAEPVDGVRRRPRPPRRRRRGVGDRAGQAEFAGGVYTNGRKPTPCTSPRRRSARPDPGRRRCPSASGRTARRGPAPRRSSRRTKPMWMITQSPARGSPREHADVDLARLAGHVDERELIAVPVGDADDPAGDPEAHGQPSARREQVVDETARPRGRDGHAAPTGSVSRCRHRW